MKKKKSTMQEMKIDFPPNTDETHLKFQLPLWSEDEDKRLMDQLLDEYLGKKDAVITERVISFLRLHGYRIIPPEFVPSSFGEMQDFMERGRYQDMISIVEHNPQSSCLQPLLRAYEDGTLKRLGIDWKP